MNKQLLILFFYHVIYFSGRESITLPVVLEENLKNVWIENMRLDMIK